MSTGIDPLHKWRVNLNNNTWYILSLTFMFQDKGFSHECEAKYVPSIVIQIYITRRLCKGLLIDLINHYLTETVISCCPVAVHFCYR